MRILVTGAYGFIGANIVAALVAANHEVIGAVRDVRIDSRFPGLTAIACDMALDVTTQDWLPRLGGVDALSTLLAFCASMLRTRSTRCTNRRRLPITGT